jgi:hypothetical protein
MEDLEKVKKKRQSKHSHQSKTDNNNMNLEKQHKRLPLINNEQKHRGFK